MKTIGILGGGQLGRMLTMEAHRLGLRTITWIGGPNDGPATVSDEIITESFDSESGFAEFVEKADCATVEFENIPATLLGKLSTKIPMAPLPEAVITAQHREREKKFLELNKIPCAPFFLIDSAEALAGALLQLPENGGILKTSEFGYDGKGQVPVTSTDNAAEIWKNFDSPRAVLEEKIDLAAELSVLVVRDREGNICSYDPAENTHTNHILDLSIVPARFDELLLGEAQSIAEEVATALDYRGVMAVEFFVNQEGQLLVNEIAPRPHNSGHHTIDACDTSQFGQQMRVACGLPIGSPRLKCPAVLWNVLGDIWPQGGEPDWNIVHATPGATLHLYGKREPRAGRKMGHITFTASTQEEALANAMRVRETLGEA